MKPEHRLMLRKVGLGLPARNFKKGEMRTMEVRDSEMRKPSMEVLEKKMEGMSIKRKPLKFKL